MSYMRPTIIIGLFSTLIWLQIACSEALSIYDITDFDNDNYNEILDNQLPAGYYYISDGRIIPAGNGIRRVGGVYSGGSSVYFQPIVRVKHQKTKKKLFVPNFFG